MELKHKVEALIAEIDKTHKYSMSSIYGLYNEVFSVAETPQSCASCLIRKVNELKQWLANQPKEKEEVSVAEDAQTADTQQPLKKKRGRKPTSLQ